MPRLMPWPLLRKPCFDRRKRKSPEDDYIRWDSNSPAVRDLSLRRMTSNPIGRSRRKEPRSFAQRINFIYDSSFEFLIGSSERNNMAEIQVTKCRLCTTVIMLSANVDLEDAYSSVCFRCICRVSRTKLCNRCFEFVSFLYDTVCLDCAISDNRADTLNA